MQRSILSFNSKSEDRSIDNVAIPENMTVLELFSGTESFSKVAREKGCRTFTVELNPKFNPDLCKDILDVEVSDIPFKPTIIWASPPCQAFSVCTIGRNWNKDHTPKTDKARHGIKMLEKTIELIKELDPTYFIIENPRGKMRRMKVLGQFPRYTVTYCQYGDDCMKPTDLWTNIKWNPRPVCKSGDKCHIPAPRGSSTGIQGRSGNMARSVVPHDLCREILEAIK